jgi:hypothetical protein
MGIVWQHSRIPLIAAQGGSTPGAPTNVTAWAIPGGVTVRFKQPAAGGSPITSYRATTTVGGFSTTQGAVLIKPSATSYMQLNRRVDIFGVTAGTPTAVTVVATNASGDGPASTASNSVTPTTLPNPYLAVPGNQGAGWGDLSYGGVSIYGVTPGTLSSNGTGSQAAPTNPVLSSRNVVEIDNGAGFQPFYQYVNPTNTLGGRLPMSQYTNLVISYWPTAASGENVGFLKTLWVDGDASIGNSGGNTVLTDTTQNWPTNIFAGAGVLNVTQNTNGYNVASNTATTITMGVGCTFAAGDFYALDVPDIACGQRISIGGGSVPGGVTGPATMTIGAWNTYTIPLTTFDSGSGDYPNVSLANILKFSSQPLTGLPASNVRWACNISFT